MLLIAILMQILLNLGENCSCFALLLLCKVSWSATAVLLLLSSAVQAVNTGQSNSNGSKNNNSLHQPGCPCKNRWVPGPARPFT